MWRKLLLALLSICLISEIFLASAGFFARDWALGLFAVAANADTYFLSFAFSWTILFIALICTLALTEVLQNKASAYKLIVLMGLWWVMVGVAIFVYSGRSETLVTDSLKGGLLLYLNRKWFHSRGRNA